MKDCLNEISNLAVHKFHTIGIWLLICGMPNVGKSTLIN